MRDESMAFLRSLLETPSPSGFEAPIQEVCRDYMKPYVDEIYKDVHGNQYHVKNKDAALRVMLAGHVDEIGLMVNTIDDFGFIGFVPIGGVDVQTLPGQRVVVHSANGPVYGVIGRKAIHLTPAEDRKKPMEMHEMWVDIGVKDREEAESLVAVADPITMDVGYRELRNNRVVSRGLDDRIGAFVCLEALRLLAEEDFEVGVFCVTTVQEEIGLRGATTSAYGCNPHAGIAVDVAWATDHPNGEGERYGKTALDAGPIVGRGPNVNPIVHQGLMAAARAEEIPIQPFAKPRGTGTDANAMQLSRGGVATAVVGIPNRYMHTPVEVVSLQDVEQASRLIARWLRDMKTDTSFIP